MVRELSKIESIMLVEYGTDIKRFSTDTILWSSCRAMKRIGVEETKKELSEINRKREKLGLPVAVHQFGHPLF